jgi:hypothetical protein
MQMPVILFKANVRASAWDNSTVMVYVPRLERYKRSSPGICMAHADEKKHKMFGFTEA